MKTIFSSYTYILMMTLCLVFLPAGAMAESITDTDSTPFFELNSTIMAIDLNRLVIVIAEKDVHLLTSTVNGKTVWQTLFKDANGKTIKVSQFEVGDRVLAKGNKDKSGRLTALSFVFLKSKNDQVVQKKSHVQPRESSPMQLKDGVWKN